MNIHEYQAKAILKNYGAPIQDGLVISMGDSLEKMVSTIDEVSRLFHTNQFVIKAQVHAGGRGKGGGVKFCANKHAALETVQKILGMQLVTHQTGPEGKHVSKILVGAAINIEKEFYVAITVDRSSGKDVFIICKEGGVDIEEVSEKNPSAIRKVYIDPLLGLQEFQCRQLIFDLGLAKPLHKQASGIFKALYKSYIEKDASIAEINPLVLTKEGSLVVLDTKFAIDDNALFRHPEMAELRDLAEEEPAEIEAAQHRLNYIKLQGNIGCMVNGAGLAMASMDIIKQAGGEPANFLDVGGTASAETVQNGLRIILQDPNVKSVLINIFGGIVRCDRVANGIVQAISQMGLQVPVVVRLQGTNSKEARKILEESGVKIKSAESFLEAAKIAVEISQGL